MIEKELQFIADFTLNKIKNLGSFFTYRKLLNTDIHPALLKYISADVDYKIYEDRKRLLQQSSFDYSGFEISKYFNLISQQIKKRTKITYDDIKSLVVEAVTFNADFTVRPNSALKELMFNEKKKVSIEEIKMKLDYLYYHSYYAEVLNSYFNKTKPLSLSRDEFEKILKKFDQSTSENKEELVEYGLNSIADYYNVGSMDKSKIPISLAEDFLIDKSLSDYLERLKHAFPEQSKQTHEIKDFTTVLFSTEPIKSITPKEPEEKIDDEEIFEVEEEFIPQKQEEENIEKKKDKVEKKSEKPVEKKTNEEEFELDISEQENLDPLYNFEEDEDDIKNKKNKTKELIEEEIKGSDEFSAAAKDEAPISKDKENNLSDEIISDEIELLEDFEFSDKKSGKIFEPTDEEAHHEKKKENQHKEKEIARDTDKAKSESKQAVKQIRKKDLFYYLSNRDIEKIVGSVFNDDREDFANTMEKISESETYEDATEVLKKIFSAYNVNPYSRDAVTLTNCVSNYFDQN